jgi:hypothetical protein
MCLTSSSYKSIQSVLFNKISVLQFDSNTSASNPKSIKLVKSAYFRFDSLQHKFKANITVCLQYILILLGICYNFTGSNYIILFRCKENA